ncbi:MAG: adenylate kinase [Ruminiclostridium sp.]|nr:adenylate kinase [Ruminiclostridium sp.]
MCSISDKNIVIGCPGSGKSTFSRKLHELTGIPLYHLDMMYWNTDRTTVDNSVFRERLSTVMQNKQWIIDGNYGSTIELRMNACDTVFFLDYPTDVCLEGVRERRGKARSDMPWVEDTDEEDMNFIEFIKDYNLHSRPLIIDLFNKYSDKAIHIFKNRNEADNFLASLLHK